MDLRAAGEAEAGAPPPGAVLPQRPPRAPSLRLLVAVTFGVLTLALGAVLGLALGRTAERAVRREIGARLAQTARQTADKLDRGMFERWRDVQVAAGLPVFGDPAASADAKRAVLERLQATFPPYAWLGFVDADMRVVASTGRVFEGGDASGRPWVREALQRPVLGDVHEAVVLAGLLPPGPDGGPLRFVDIGAPVPGPDGVTPVGVLAAHLSWSWADEVRRSMLEPSGRQDGVEILVASRDGTVLLGPPAAALGKLPSGVGEGGAAGRSWRVEGGWPDGAAYLTATAATAGHEDYPGLGWRVVARMPAAEAFAPARALGRRLAATAVGAAALFAALAWLASGWIARPLDALTRAAERLREGAEGGGAGPLLPDSRRYREVASLSRALEDLLRTTALQRRQLEDGIEEKTTLLREIHHRVKNNLQLIVSLLRMDLRRAEDQRDPAAERFERAVARVHTIGLVHEQLYGAPNLARVDLARHLRRLAAHAADIARLPGREVAVEVEADPVRCTVDTAVPLGLIANELIANSLKHAFRGRDGGRVRVSLRRAGEDGAVRLTVADDGIGGGPALDGGDGGGGIGRKLVAALARQLGGSLREEPGGRGWTVVLDLPPGRCDPAAAGGPADGPGRVPTPPG